MKTIKSQTKRTVYNKVVNYDQESEEITVLDYVFDHGAGFKGATGSRFRPISKDEYEERMKLSSIEEMLKDRVPLEDIPNKFLYNDKDRIYKNPYKMWAKAIIVAGEAEEAMFDTSYSELWDYIRETIGLSKKQAFIFECTGGGRCFDKKFQGNVNPELSEIIRQYES